MARSTAHSYTAAYFRWHVYGVKVTLLTDLQAFTVAGFGTTNVPIGSNIEVVLKYNNNNLFSAYGKAPNDATTVAIVGTNFYNDAYANLPKNTYVLTLVAQSGTVVDPDMNFCVTIVELDPMAAEAGDRKPTSKKSRSK